VSRCCSHSVISVGWRSVNHVAWRGVQPCTVGAVTGGVGGIVRVRGASPWALRSWVK
jgi:hypothetical protein